MNTSHGNAVFLPSYSDTYLESHDGLALHARRQEKRTK
jgi:hypothetical protein